MLTWLLEKFLTRFIQPGAVRVCWSLLAVTYGDAKVQKDDEDLATDRLAYPIVETLSQNEKRKCVSFVWQYFTTACEHIHHKFPLEDAKLKKAEVVQPQSLDSASFNSLRGVGGLSCMYLP